METQGDKGANTDGAATLEEVASPNQYKVKINDVEITLGETQGIHFGKVVTIGSRKIQLKLVEKFNILPKQPEAKSVRDDVRCRISSQWKKGTRDIIRGLPSRDEEDKYLPKYIGFNSKDTRWEEKLTNYWANYSINVPNDDKGVEFEAGFKIIDDKTREAAPIDLEGYMSYNWCLENGNVANVGETNMITYRFRMIDKTKDTLDRKELFSKKKEVDVKYLKLIRSKDPKDTNTVDWLLETYGGPTGVGMSIKGMDTLDKEMALEELKNKNILKFNEYLNDTNLELKALIKKCVSHGLLTLQGNTYFLSDKPLGDNDHTVGYLSDPANSGERLKLQERLKAAMNL